MSTDQVEIIKAVVAALATVITALFVLLGVIYQTRKPSTTKPPVVGDTGKALEQFNGTQNEFMALVIADNKGLRTELETVKSMVTEIKTHQDNFINAVKRYLVKLAASWPGPEHMPWPDDEDFPILEDMLPPSPRRRRKKDIT